MTKQQKERSALTLAELESRIEKARMPKEALARARSELKKLKGMAPMSAEATVVRKDRFDVEIKPLDDEQREKLHVHAGGHQLVVTLKPGAVLGDFKDELTIKTDHPAMKVKKVPVGGKVTGPISFMPANCKMTVDSKQGATKEVRITVRNQAETEWTITAPKGLETEVRATEQINKAADGSVRMRTYVLTVTVPAGAKSGLIRGDIVLQTNHPLAREVRLPLDITIIGG